MVQAGRRIAPRNPLFSGLPSGQCSSSLCTSKSTTMAHHKHPRSLVTRPSQKPYFYSQYQRPPAIYVQIPDSTQKLPRKKKERGKNAIPLITAARVPLPLKPTQPTEHRPHSAVMAARRTVPRNHRQRIAPRTNAPPRLHVVPAQSTGPSRGTVACSRWTQRTLADGLGRIVEVVAVVVVGDVMARWVETERAVPGSTRRGTRRRGCGMLTGYTRRARRRGDRSGILTGRA
jgi:hypothetical protein